MEKRLALSMTSAITLVGVLFSGYLTYYTYTSGRSGCELFIGGLPSCSYGLIMYMMVFALALSLAAGRATRNAANIAMSIIALAGVLFAGYLTYAALSSISCTNLSILGLPPCVYGLVMYLVLLALALYGLSRR